MVDKIRDSPFFGDRIINFTREILGHRVNPTPITDFEKKLLKKADEIRDLNQDLDGKLVTILQEAKKAIVPATALRLLLYFKKLDRLQDAHKIIYFAGRDETILTEEDIADLVKELRKDPQASIELWLAILGGEPEPESGGGGGPKLNLPQDFR